MFHSHELDVLTVQEEIRSGRVHRGRGRGTLTTPRAELPEGRAFSSRRGIAATPVIREATCVRAVTPTIRGRAATPAYDKKN